MTSINHTTLTLTASIVRSVQLMANGSLADLAEVVHPLARNREAIAEPPATRGQGPAAFYATAQWLRDAFGDLVVVHATMSGRQIGAFVAYGPDGAPAQVFPATGKRFAVTQSHWFPGRRRQGHGTLGQPRRQRHGNATRVDPAHAGLPGPHEAGPASRPTSPHRRSTETPRSTR